MEAVQLLLRSDTLFLSSVARSMGVLSGSTLLEETSALVCPLERHGEVTSEWRYSRQAMQGCYSLCRELSVTPPILLAAGGRDAYRRKLRKLSRKLPAEQHLWTALGFHMHNHTHFVEVSEAMAAVYGDAKSRVARAKSLLAHTPPNPSFTAALQPLEVAFVHIADRIELMAEDSTSLSYTEATPQVLAMRTVEEAMGAQVTLLETEVENYLRRRRTAVKEEHLTEDAHVVELLLKRPKLP